MSESHTRSPFPDLDFELGEAMRAFGDRVRSRRSGLRYTLSQPSSGHYASTTLLSFVSDTIQDDLVVAGITLDLRSGRPVWSIDLVTGQGSPLAEKVVSPAAATAMADDPRLARRELEAFLDANLDAVLAALSHVTLRDAE